MSVTTLQAKGARTGASPVPPTRPARRARWGGLLYVASAIGLELIQNAERALDVSQLSLHMIALVSAEETGEMLAVAILLRTLLTKLAELGDRYPLTLRLDASNARA